MTHQLPTILDLIAAIDAMENVLYGYDWVGTGSTSGDPERIEAWRQWEIVKSAAESTITPTMDVETLRQTIANGPYKGTDGDIAEALATEYMRLNSKQNHE